MKIQAMSYPLSRTYPLLYILLISIALVQATGGGQRNSIIMANLEITFRTPDDERTVVAGLAVPPIGLRGLNFIEVRNFVKFTVSPPGVRCLLRKAMPEEGEGEETFIASSTQEEEDEEDDEQSEPIFSSRNRYIKHLSPVFGKITENDNLSSSINIEPLDQLWKRVLCFQSDGSEVKILLEFEGGGYEFISIRPNRFGWESKEIDNLELSQRDILRSTILQAPSEKVKCAITGKSLFAFLRYPLKRFKLEETLYERLPGGSYAYILCLDAK